MYLAVFLFVMWKPFASQAIIQTSFEVNFFLIRFILKGLAPKEGIIVLGFFGHNITKLGLVSKACDALKKRLKIK